MSRFNGTVPRERREMEIVSCAESDNQSCATTPRKINEVLCLLRGSLESSVNEQQLSSSASRESSSR